MSGPPRVPHEQGETRDVPPRRPVRFGGFWALGGGAVVIAVALLVLRPVVDQRDCPNYGGSGNASAFGGDRLDGLFLLLLLGWLTAVLVEQALPVAWRDRRPAEIALRAVAAVLLALTGSCCLALGLLTVCH
ncbi:hypothetical protein [Micromonospora sp. WMMD998]|uniref:hypothetical protein n=1 Tax=Micromonospora sp. WMMD998 TaxID=3016092 RepID=UPI00249A4758|nr:hypothetical protein [Micromonospora sp. WMMD998]WFE39362.1 hypothetical protein O7619_13400 [Micromonospora sp. WMMD998]